MRNIITFGAVFGLVAACGGTSSIGKGTGASNSTDGGTGATTGTGGAENTGGSVSTGGRSTGGSVSTGGSLETGGRTSTGGALQTGGTTSTGGGTGVSCTVNADCPPSPPICKPCSDGSCKPYEPVCVDGTCAFSEPCATGSECVADKDCPIPPMACKMCGDAGCANTWTHCVSGQCSSGYDPCPSSELRWYKTCGYPVCRDPEPPLGIAMCDQKGGQEEGLPCSKEGSTCDAGFGCGEHLECAPSDPTHGGVCPISRAKYKQDIEYVSHEERTRLASELQSIPLVRYRYKENPSREHLGFIIEDIEPSPSVDSRADRVDLYGYTSMAVAALQEQHAQIQALEREVKELKAALRARRQPSK